eukprot:85992-Ditylum_brightwellii.AAC.1
MADSKLIETARDTMRVARYETSETLKSCETLRRALLDTGSLYQSILMNREQRRTVVENNKETDNHHDPSESTTDTDIRRPTLFSQQPIAWTDTDDVYQSRHAGNDNDEDEEIIKNESTLRR